MSATKIRGRASAATRKRIDRARAVRAAAAIEELTAEHLALRYPASGSNPADFQAYSERSALLSARLGAWWMVLASTSREDEVARAFWRAAFRAARHEKDGAKEARDAARFWAERAAQGAGGGRDGAGPMSAGSSGRERFDERPEAVAHADAAAAGWRAVVHAQLSATADHGDFYALAGSVVETLAAVEALARVLVRQVGGYADTVAGSGGRVYDDTRAVDPEIRLFAAAERLEHLSAAVAAAGRRADEFWQAIGHVGVEPDVDAEPDPEQHAPGAGVDR